MDYCEFSSMDEEGRAFATWHFGTYLMSRWQDQYEFRLFALNDFYVEVAHTIVDNKILDFSNFRDLSRLDPYLLIVDIEALCVESA